MIKFPFENLSDCIFHHALWQPAAPALIQGHETVSYQALANLVEQAAVYLRAKGVMPGNRVGIAMTNCIDRVVVSFACLRMGAVTLELPTDITAPVLASFVTRFNMSATIVEIGGPNSTAPIALRLGLDWRQELVNFTGDARYEGDSSELTFIILSSGSTGLPKGTITTHRQRIFRSEVYANQAGFYTEENPGVLVLAAPASTSLLAQFLTTQLLIGGATVLLPVWRYLIELVREIAAWEDSICPVPPVIGKSFLSCAPSSGLLFPKMRALAISGQPLPSHDKVEMVKHLTPNLYDIYGCAGFGLIACIGPADIADQSVSVGKPLVVPGVDVEVAGPDGKTLLPGAIGQLRVRGPNAASGFYHPEDNNHGTERFADGWYYPGEVALIDKAGYLILAGRIADAIKIGALTIYPPEIEDVITQHPQVAEAVVVGRPGPAGVDEIYAFVVGKPGYRQDEINAYCRRKFTGLKKPKYVYYFERIPRTANGKIDRPALKAAAVRRIDPL